MKRFYCLLNKTKKIVFYCGIDCFGYTVKSIYSRIFNDRVKTEDLPFFTQFKNQLILDFDLLPFYVLEQRGGKSNYFGEAIESLKFK